MEFDDDQTGSDHIDDRRDEPAPYVGGGGFGGGGLLDLLPWLLMGRGGFGFGTVLVLLAVAWFAGVGPTAHGPTGPTARHAPASHAHGDDAQKQRVAKILKTTETCWEDLFREQFGKPYTAPTLTLFRRAVRSACGVQGSAVGPFYCPADRHVYLDLAFFDELANSLGARGDFAQAYVIAHEVGHHVQNLLGTSRKVEGLGRIGGERERLHASVHLELQADYYAGVWAHHVVHRQPHVRLDPGDYEEAITAARAVGDDTLQRRATGHVVPENFTHGSAAQRAKWFRLGFESGDPKAHDPFVEEK